LREKLLQMVLWSLFDWQYYQHFFSYAFTKETYKLQRGFCMMMFEYNDIIITQDMVIN